MEASVLLFLISILVCIFGIFYLIYMTRHRERLALIDKGEDASLFYPAGKTIGNLRKFITLNIALTLLGIGVGILMAIVLYPAFENDAIYPASIFVFAGLGLLSGFLLNRKLEDQQY